MITNDNKNWLYLAVKSLSRLLKGITSNHVGDFYCLNCLHSYRTKESLEKHKKVYKDHDYYSDLECLLEKIDTCQNDPRKSSTEKI